MKFYVYVILNPFITNPIVINGVQIKNQPIYVGKGKGLRCFDHFKSYDLKYTSNISKNNFLYECINAGYEMKKHVYKIYDNLSEEDAFKHEVELIAYFGRRDINTGVLYNMTDGGEGASGLMSKNKGKSYEEIHGVEKAILLKSEKKKRFAGNNNPMFGIAPYNKGRSLVEIHGAEKAGLLKLKQKQGAPIYQYTISGEYVASWKDIEECSKHLTINKSALHNVLLNISKTAGGFQWKRDLLDSILPVKPRHIYEYLCYTLNGIHTDTFFTLSSLAENFNITVSTFCEKFAKSSEVKYKGYIIKKVIPDKWLPVSK